MPLRPRTKAAKRKRVRDKALRRLKKTHNSNTQSMMIRGKH
jgi:hypothetical protein